MGIMPLKTTRYQVKTKPKPGHINDCLVVEDPGSDGELRVTTGANERTRTVIRVGGLGSVRRRRSVGHERSGVPKLEQNHSPS